MKKIIISFSILLSLLFITGCFNPIFYDILTDVPPESATVSGNINSIARYNIDGTEFLFLAADKGLRYKKADSDSHDEWNVFDTDKLPFILHKYAYYASEGLPIGHNGQEILKVLTDSDTIYLVSVEYTTDDNAGITCPLQFHIWAAKFALVNSEVSLSGEWKDISATLNAENKLLTFQKDSNNSFYFTFFNVFGTNSPKAGNRKVFIRSTTPDKKSTKYYRLNGLNEPEEFTPANIIDKTENGLVNSAAYIGSGSEIFFFESKAVTTNETVSSNASYAYFGTAEALKYTDGSKDSKDNYIVKTAISNVGEPISCLAACSNALLIGRANESTYYVSRGGIVKTSLKDGVPGTTLESFKTNATSQINTNYLIYTLLNADPSKAELESCLYTSIGFIGTGSNYAVSYDNIGLWSYYPKRGNWNRE